jgi:ParB family chromosome partitioning protein
MVEDTMLVDTVTGEPVDEADVDWSTEHHPEQVPAEGARHADTVMDKTVWAPEYYCRDPQACGLTPAEFLTRAEPIVHGHGEQSDAETAEARAEAQRTERRKVLALNKLGVAAQEVRRAWVRDHLLARRSRVRRCSWRPAWSADPACWSTTRASRSWASFSASGRHRFMTR